MIPARWLHHCGLKKLKIDNFGTRSGHGEMSTKVAFLNESAALPMCVKRKDVCCDIISI